MSRTSRETRTSGGVAVAPAEPRRSGPHKAVERLERLNEIARLLAAFETVEQTFEAAVTVAAQTLSLDAAILIEAEGETRRMTLWAPAGGREVSLASRTHLEETFAYLVGSGPAQPPSFLAKRFIVMPLVVAGRPIFGALQMEAAAFDKDDLLFISAFASQVAVALDRDRAWRSEVARREHAEAMQMTLSAQARALIAADNQRSQLLSTLAEELRASLAEFRQIQQLMRAGGDRRIDKAVESMNGQIQQTSQLIDDLRELSNLTQVQAQEHSARVEIGAILALAGERGTERLTARGQSLTVTLPTIPAYLDADAVRLGEVLDALIDKASELVSPGGRIWMTGRVSAGGSGEPPLPGGSTGPQVVVTLRDDGAGEVKAILPRVYDLLNAGGRQIDPGDPRFGSGLLQARRIVELHGGLLGACSSGFGQGSEFEIRLPIVGRNTELGPERHSS